jgi:DNA-binding MarR family transcriptional regulator
VTTHPGDGLEGSLVAALSHELGRHARLLHAMKNSMAALVPEGLDVASFPLLLALVRCGPRRQGELAEESFLDPSTVSRHVAQLARAGYVERRPHPQDGRAVQLVATEAGERVARELSSRRQAMVAGALASWNPEDVRTLVTLMARLNDDLDAFRPQARRPGVSPMLDEPPRGPALHSTAPLPDPRSPDQENA